MGEPWLWASLGSVNREWACSYTNLGGFVCVLSKKITGFSGAETSIGAAPTLCLCGPDWMEARSGGSASIARVVPSASLLASVFLPVCLAGDWCQMLPIILLWVWMFNWT